MERPINGRFSGEAESAAPTRMQPLRPGPAATNHVQGEAVDVSGDGLLEGCLRRIRSWRISPNWSAHDWYVEMRVQAAAALWQAQCEYDSSRGVPLSAFVRSRILASARTRYRQEWRYALHCPSQNGGYPDETETDEPSFPCDSCDRLSEALDRISQADRWLIEQLFWLGCSEAVVARQLGISQPAVSKRKKLILGELRRCVAEKQSLWL